MTKRDFNAIIDENQNDKKYRIYFTSRKVNSIEDCCPPKKDIGFSKKICREKFHKFSKIADDRYKNIYMKRDS